MSKSNSQIRGYVRPSRRHGQKEQMAALQAAGVDPALVYVEGKAETLGDCLQSLRSGDTLAVATLSRLHNRRDGILAVVAELNKKGIGLLEAKTGRTFNGQLLGVVEAVVEALDELANDRRRMTKAEARRAAQIRHSRTPTDVARRIWQDAANYPTIGEALSHADMDGWDKTAAYRKLGKRGTQVRAKT